MYGKYWKAAHKISRTSIIYKKFFRLYFPEAFNFFLEIEPTIWEKIFESYSRIILEQMESKITT